MFDVIALKDRTPEITEITICPESIAGKLYSYEIVFNCGSKNTNLIPILKDIVGTACPFLDTGRFKPEYLRFITVTVNGIALSYRDPDAEDTNTTVDLFIDLDDIYDALRQTQFLLGIYFYDDAANAGANIKKGNTDLCEAYDFSFDIDSDTIYVSVATEKTEGDFCLVEMPIHLGEPVEPVEPA